MAITRAQQAKQMLQKGGRANPFDVGFNVAEAAANVGRASTASQNQDREDRQQIINKIKRRQIEGPSTLEKM